MAKRTENRPPIDDISTSVELRRWYWLKSELVEHAKALGLRSSGGKFTILDRIAHFFDTGARQWPGDVKTKARSKFDWHSEVLTPETVITDSYRNSQNVRRFFKAHVGPQFKFNIAFMDWMRSNAGQTLADAVAEFNRQAGVRNAPDFTSEIAHHNQFNQYTRDFLADNPDLCMADVRRVWALKRQQPSDTGRHVYDRSDLDLS